MRFLCIDPGDKRTGLAVGDDGTRIVSPVAVIEAGNEEVRLSALLRAVAEHEPGELVVGLALNMDGSEGPAAAKAKSLAATLHERTKLPVHLVDERLTSYAAEAQFAGMELTRGRKKQRRDALAAAMILRDFFESRGK